MNQLRKEIDNKGTIKYFNSNNELHNPDGPALIYSSGNKFWFLNGKKHRTDGPAVILVNGTEFWFLNGKCHRTNGPALIYSDGSKFWFLNSKQYSEQEFRNKIKNILINNLKQF